MTARTATPRQMEALNLRAQGLTWSQVAQRMGVNSGATAQAYAARAAMRIAEAAGSTRNFGVEIEFIGIDCYAAASAIARAGITCSYEGYTHRVMAGWKVVTDASVSNGGEVVSPILSGQDGFDQLRKVLVALQDAGAAVNTSTGLHVHHDCNGASGVDLVKIVEAYNTNQFAINQIVSRSRRNSRWARTYSTSEIQDMKDSANRGSDARTVARHAGYGDRYKTVNTQAFLKYGTVEFRQHQGSLNPKKIIAWVKFGQALIEAAIKMDALAQEADMAALAALLVTEGGLEQDVADYLARRAQDMD